MKTSSAIASLATLAALAGLAASAFAAEPPTLQLLDPDRLVPTRAAGVLYVNLATGERTLTRYDLTEIPEISATHATAAGALFDFWMSIDENPCWEGSLGDHMPGAGFAYILEDGSIDVTGGYTEPVAAFDFGDMPFDSKITGVILSTTTLALEDTDSNADGVLDTGIDAVAVYYDALSETNSTSIAPPTAAVRVELIPGDTGSIPNGFPHYDIIVDFGGEHFELGDSDGLERGTMWLPGAAPGQDIVGTAFDGFIVDIADGLADFQYLQHYVRHASNQRLTGESVFINFAAPEGEITTSTYVDFTNSCTTPSMTTTVTDCTGIVTDFHLIPDPMPQGQGVNESFGLAVLGTGADVSNLSPVLDFGVCCYWWGGLDCAGFLDQLEPNPPYNPTWYNFRPYSQIYHGFFSDAPPQTQCDSINFAEDTVLDNADIYAFIQFFLAQDPIADLNHDTFLDNGDITSFINLFLTCTG